MDQETVRLRALAAATARRLTAKKQGKDPLESTKRQDPPAKRPRFTFSDEPNALPPPALMEAPSAPDAVEGIEAPKKDWHHWYAAAQAAEAATMAGTEGITESYTLVEIPDEFTGLLIGKHGIAIKQMQESTGAVLCVGKLAVEGLRKVCVTGCPESQEAAKASLLSFVEQQQEFKKFQEQQVIDYLEVPNKFAGRLIGIRGEVIRQVRDAYGVRAALDDCVDEPMRKLELRGHAQAVQYAKQHVELLLLEVYRRFRIYNAPLESKYNNTSFLFESPLLQTQSAMKQQQDMELLLSPWAAHFAGNLDCVSIFKKFQSLEEAKIPGVDIEV